MAETTSTQLTTTRQSLSKPISQLASYDDFAAIGAQLIDSGFMPTYISDIPTMVSILMLGKELNFTPMSAIQNIINVQGKLSLTSAGMIALLRRANMRLRVIQDFEPVMGEVYKNPADPSAGTTEGVVDYITTLELMEVWEGEIVKNRMSSTWTDLVNAATEGGTKSLPKTYVKYKKHMAFARCVTRLIRSIAADTLAGSNYATVEIGMDANVDMQMIHDNVEIVHEDINPNEYEDTEYEVED